MKSPPVKKAQPVTRSDTSLNSMLGSDLLQARGYIPIIVLTLVI